MRKKSTSRKSETDWKRIDAMEDEDIDFSDIPELTPEMFAHSVVRRNLKPIPRKKQLTLRVDSDCRLVQETGAWISNQNQFSVESLHDGTSAQHPMIGFVEWS